MNLLDIIIKKREKQKLSRDDITFWIRGVTSDTFPDYQNAALLMAIFLNGMDAEETASYFIIIVKRFVRSIN